MRFQRSYSRIALLLGAILGTAMSPDFAQSQTTVTLQDAVDRALGRSPSLAQAENALLNAETSRETSIGSFLPTLSTSAGAGLGSSQRFDAVTGEVVTGTSTSSSLGLRASYSLFEGGSRFYEFSRSKADIGSADARLQDTRNQVIFQTKSLFFASLATRELLDVAIQREDRAQQALDFIQRQVEFGTSTRSDLLRSQLELANAQQAVLQARATDRAARFALGRQIGFAEPADPEVPEGLGPRPLPLSEDEIFTLAEDASPAVQAAALSTESSELGIKSSRTAYLPSLNWSGGYNWNNGAIALTGGRTSWSMSFSASYPIFQGFTRDVAVQRAREGYRVAVLQETDARLGARQEADRALQGIYTAEQAIAIAEEQVRVAEEDLRVVSERYRVGVAIILDLLASQIAVTEAQVALVQARLDYELAWADLESILGREL